MDSGCGKMYLTINPPEEISIYLGKAGGCPAAQFGVIWRLADLIMRLGGTLEEIKGELSGIQCPKISSCADAIIKAFKRQMGVDKKN